LCSYFLSIIKLKSDNNISYIGITKSDKKFALIIWFEIGLLFLFAHIDFFKQYVYILLIAFQITIIMGFLRQGFRNYYKNESKNKLLNFILCLIIILFVISLFISFYIFSLS